MLFDRLYAAAEKLSEIGGSVSANISASVVSASPSAWNLFWKAEFIVQLIMIGLVCASVWSWAIILDKTRRLKRLEIAANEFEDKFWESGSLDSLYERINNRPTDPLMAMFCAAMREWKYALSKGRSKTELLRLGLEQRIDRVMHLVINREISALERHTGFLASLGSNGMIIGLFGTVLGIMHSFQSIALQQSANLAVVAPGIAEALLATALGLVAAIPAAISYNVISSDLNRYANHLDAFANEFSAIISRQLEDSSFE